MKKERLFKGNKCQELILGAENDSELTDIAEKHY